MGGQHKKYAIKTECVPNQHLLYDWEEITEILGCYGLTQDASYHDFEPSVRFPSTSKLVEFPTRLLATFKKEHSDVSHQDFNVPLDEY